MKKICCFILLIASCAGSFAKQDPINDLWNKANSFYTQKEFDSAAACYERVAAVSPKNTEVYYNLGNSYYKLNKIGAAVLNYERALRLNPSHKAAAENLELTQSRIPNRIQRTNEIFFVRWWQKVANPQHATVWAIVSLALFLVILSFFFLRRTGRTPSWFRPQVVVILSFVFIASVLIAFTASREKTRHDLAVVVQQDAPFHTSIKESRSQSLVPEGTVVKCEGEQSGWTEVRLPDGRRGWIEKSMLVKI